MKYAVSRTADLEKAGDMKDRYGRLIYYMRISVTKSCNLSCRYCMPPWEKREAAGKLLSDDEIYRAAKAAAELGITHFKLTGGEPFMRPGIVQLAASIRALPNAKAVTITTNGVMLARYAKDLKEAGIDAVNVSLDTLETSYFQWLTGYDALEQVLAGIEAGLSAGLFIKLNAVQGREADGKALVDFAQQRGMIVRFIELMPVGYGKNFVPKEKADLFDFLQKHYGKAQAIEKKSETGSARTSDALSSIHFEDNLRLGAGPAEYYRFEKLRCPVGLIRAVSRQFCDNCNRIRLTAEGKLKLCLSFEDGVDLRELLKCDSKDRELIQIMEQAIFSKPKGHCFLEPEKITERRSMITFGG